MEHISECIANFYASKNIIKCNEKEAYQYGIYLILNDIVTFSIIILISIFLWKFRYSIEFLSVFCFTRAYCGGYHASKAYVCRLTMIITFLMVIILSSLLENISERSLCIILICSFSLSIPFIPVKHPNKELTPELVRKGRVKGTLVFALFSLSAVLIFKYFEARDGVIIALTLSAVSALVIIGVITNERRACNE
ncbi:MAG: accessory gene regulator B family protein [Clostridia bacterium]|nr:accessory gene regulator B family protein [Clostridia bacterium]